MRNISITPNTPRVGVIWLFLLYSVAIQGQPTVINLTSSTGRNVRVELSGHPAFSSGNPGPICDNTIQTHTYTNTSNTNDTIVSQVQAALAAIPPANRVQFRANELFTLQIYPAQHHTYHDAPCRPNNDPPIYDPNDICYNHPSSNPSGYAQYFPIYCGVDGIVPDLPNTAMEASGSSSIMEYTFTKGSLDGYICIPFREEAGSSGYYVYTNFIIPFAVEGTTADEGEEIPILGTIKEPQIPYLVLHAPPGANSSSEFTQTTTNCREFETSAIQDASNSGKLGVKLGGKGSVGLVINLDYEFYVQFNAGFSGGGMEMTTTSERTCVTVSQGLSTAAATEFVGGGDVFVGYGTDLEVGIYERCFVDENTCTAVIDTGLVYAPVGAPREFVKSTKTIQQDIEDLAAKVADESRTVEQRNNDQNQIDVWNQVLAMNQANINASDNEVLEPTTEYDLVSPVSKTITVSTINTAEIIYEYYSETTLGIETLAEIGGSGISGGYEFKSSKRFGQTQNQSGETATTMQYTLHDDDGGDQFNIKIVRDPMYGTPIFKLEEGSKTSCPYQGGIQRDKPYLEGMGSESFATKIMLKDLPVGQPATTSLKICNNSNEARTYRLKLDDDSNINPGAIVTVDTKQLGGNEFLEFDGPNDTGIPAGQCITTSLFIEQNPLAPEVKVFENIKLFLYPECEPGLRANFFVSAYFGDSYNVCDADNLNLTQTFSDMQVQRAANTIQASNTIEPTANIVYSAGQTITLAPGFHAKAQSTFTARIASCTPASVAQIESRTEETFTAIPADLSLKLFPNPTNGLTTIQYDLPETGEVQLSISDIQGRIVRTLSQNLEQQAGQHQVEWNASDVPSGLYFVRVQTADDFRMQKLMVAKSW